MGWMGAVPLSGTGTGSTVTVYISQSRACSASTSVLPAWGATGASTLRIADAFVRIRRFLRDPSARIWSDDDLLTYWNDSQQELATKARDVLEKWTILRYPPRWDCSYQWDWERYHCEATNPSDDYYQWSTEYVLRGMHICYPWEGTQPSAGDTLAEGTTYTHPWEASYVSGAESPPLPLPWGFDRATMAYYDEEPISPASTREVGIEDNHYRTRTGEPTQYYQRSPDGRRLHLYPQPSAVWSDDVVSSASAVGSMVIGVTSDVGGETPTADNLLLVYSAVPADVRYTTEFSRWPEWAARYLECATLERAFGADTDGFIPSLRDYWRVRKELGIKVLNHWSRARMRDRTFRLGGTAPRAAGRLPYPRLPSSYQDEYV